jgi:hypothetical protein
MLHEVFKAPATSNDLCVRLNIADDNGVKIMRQFHRRGSVHVHAWERRPKSPAQEVWGFGPGIDAKRPMTQRGTIPTLGIDLSRYTPSTSVIAFSLTLDALREGADIYTIMELSGLNKSTVQPLIKQLRELRMIHACEYLINTQGPPTPVLKLGERFSRSSLDAPRPSYRFDNNEAARRRHSRDRFQNLSHRVAATSLAQQSDSR